MKLRGDFVYKLILVTALLIGVFVCLEGQFAGGSGTAADPWQIETAEHLNNVRNYLGEAHNDKHFIQTANIDLTDFLWDEEANDYINDGAGWVPIGNQTNRFTGKYNGNGETISGLYLNRLESINQGLFGYADGAVITNLGVTDAEITGGAIVGVLAGIISNTTVTNCFSTGTVNGLSYTGGLVGRSSGTSDIVDCYSDAVVSIYEPLPLEGMVFVQGTVGVTFNPGGFGYFTPAASYNVSLSSFYIGKNTVTQSEWTAVMGGIYNPGWTAGNGLGANYPAYLVSWFDAIEYCNRRSIIEGLTPCYSYTDGDGAHGTNPANWPAGWNTSNTNHTNVSCNWNADGYRLPTEMEREYAARGGVLAATAGTPTFNHTYAGTNVAGTGAGQLGAYAWYDANNTPTGAKAVGTKLPNELGLYDMSGNVFNWCWDRRDGDLPTGTVTDPKGKDSGTHRVLRGGSWPGLAAYCTVASRYGNLYASNRGIDGFRVSRIIP